MVKKTKIDRSYMTLGTPVAALAEQARIQREQARISRRIAAAERRATLIETTKFMVTSAALFIALFSMLNYGAYSKNFVFWWQGEHASALMSSVLASSTSMPVAAAPQPAAPVKLAIPQVAARSSLPQLPPLRLAVAPPDDRVIVSRLNIHAPIHEPQIDMNDVGDWSDIERQIQDALKDGVVHFPGSGRFGQIGNAFITGHSSYYPWDDGRYKDVFALLPKVLVGDEVDVWSGGKEYIYRVTDTDKVQPSQTEVLAPTTDKRLTMMTCYPVGTSLKRFIVTAELESVH